MATTPARKDHKAQTDWIKEFRDAAILRFQGEFLGVDAIRDAGMHRYSDLVRERDALGPGGRDILIPLLEDPDASVRVIAASYLLANKPDIALPVLEDISENCITEAHISASSTLIIYSLGKWEL